MKHFFKDIDLRCSTPLRLCNDENFLLKLPKTLPFFFQVLLNFSRDYSFFSSKPLYRCDSCSCWERCLHVKLQKQHHPLSISVWHCNRFVINFKVNISFVLRPFITCTSLILCLSSILLWSGHMFLHALHSSYILWCEVSYHSTENFLWLNWIILSIMSNSCLFFLLCFAHSTFVYLCSNGIKD